MVYICVAVCNICSINLDTGKGGHWRYQLQSGNRNQNGGGCHYGLGNGFSHPYTKRYFRNQQKELDILNNVGLGNGDIVAVLLQSTANRGCFQSGSD